MTGWKTLALNRLELLEEEADALAQPVVVKDHLRSELGRIRAQHQLGQAASRDGSLGVLVGGAEVNHTWDELHRVEARIDELKPLAAALDDARRHAIADLAPARQKKLEDDLKAHHAADEQRALAVGVIREAHSVSAVKHEGERQQQRGIFALSLLLVVFAVAAVLLQWSAFPQYPLIPEPAGGVVLAPWLILVTVMVFGAMGGAFSALMSLYVAPFKTDTYWFEPRPTLTIMKISLGIWTAVLGVVGLGEGLLTGTYANLSSLIFLSFVLGYAQQAVTSMLDKRVEALAAKP